MKIQSWGMDYFSLAFREFRDFFELFLFGAGELSEEASRIPEKSREALQPLGGEKKILLPRQVHGKRILLPQETFEKVLPEGDGIFLSDSSWRGLLRFADCCPLILFSTDPSPWMLLLHVGFRGALEGIVQEGWKTVRKRFPEISPESCRAFVGPAIRGCCYSRKMEDPLTLRGRNLFSSESWQCREDLCFFDLPRMGLSLLQNLGMRRERIWVLEECVCCGPSKWYSYRRGNREQRNVLLGGLRK